ncbi:Outer membrane lipoprotein Omp16 precursor [Rhodobacteraceae bacterium THAF1]|uniref:peptidoglycan-associated lipoprotein Pal n=1 Tax=Palleronia sp. THAF1 TaxID=2587842 RepID=UPI000F3E2332|nr:peptidoglycan-associated lipoprotein Pal [Palleronia sp. THAF1]QFU07388.1 Outer membrane lipoprotein Omp16 precursor [Palleronia sp. THAF1]VDC20700.1 Outer membrane lipoprotein Omp16 precursor [Rhodobacteraceae bacterium THAF1]
MRIATKTLMVLGVLALGACSNPDRFGAGGPMDAMGNGAGMNGGLGTTAGVTQGALDPSSPAYFSETVGDRVLFAVDQSTLNDAGRQALSAQAQWLNSNPSYTAIVEGHADEQGTREYNLALGARRAASARDFLVSQGVSAARLRTVTYGKERPIEVCSTEACYAQNRRAVTVIAAGAATS